jgi:hypothetical protein
MGDDRVQPLGTEQVSADQIRQTFRDWFDTFDDRSLLARADDKRRGGPAIRRWSDP